MGKIRHSYLKLYYPHCSWSGEKTLDLCFHLSELEPVQLLEIFDKCLTIYIRLIIYFKAKAYLYWWETGPLYC